MSQTTMESRPELADVTPAMWERVDAIIAELPPELQQLSL